MADPGRAPAGHRQLLYNCPTPAYFITPVVKEIFPEGHTSEGTSGRPPRVGERPEMCIHSDLWAVVKGTWKEQCWPSGHWQDNVDVPLEMGTDFDYK